MPLTLYKKAFEQYFNSAEFEQHFNEAVKVIKSSKRIFFLGNGGSNSICSHMMEDFAKMAKIPTFCFSDAAMITCYANDYGYENAFAEWLKVHFTEGDLLVAISSSGNSKNILNAVNEAKNRKGKVITLTGFKSTNSLKQTGDVNFWIQSESYGVVECYHQVILHAALDHIIA